MTTPSYVGRFAPSPTGPLHFGSLFTAVGSYLDAKAHQGQWLVRIEDLDPPREMDGAVSLILEGLEAHGLHWDREVVQQSQRSDHYDEAIDRILDQGLGFYCRCSRKQLQPYGGVYPGTCRGRRQPFTEPCSIRVQVASDQVVRFNDLLQGSQAMALGETSGDFNIRRKDGYYAYHLAVVIDDGLQGITHIIRGLDLLECTAPHWYLQELFELPHPSYGHLPLIIHPDGSKLSKQTFATPLDNTQAIENLRWVLAVLTGQQPPKQVNLGDLLAWGVDHWDRCYLTGKQEIPEPKTY